MRKSLFRRRPAVRPTGTLLTPTASPPLSSTASSNSVPSGNTTWESLTSGTELRRRTQQRASDLERQGHEDSANVLRLTKEEKERWWPKVNTNWTGHMFSSVMDPNQSLHDGLSVKEMREVDSPDRPMQLSEKDSTFFAGSQFMGDEVFDETRRMIAPPTFDPSIDEIEDEGYGDSSVIVDVVNAVEEDRKRMEAFGNPLLVEDQVDHLLQPQRDTHEAQVQRQEFNGFVHWGLLHAAHMILEEQQDFKKAHELVNRYMRDVDMYQKWLKHPKVMKHVQKKFGIDVSGKYDKLMALTLSMYTRSKIQVYEDDPAGALKSLTAAMSFLSDGGDMKLERHRKMLGATLAARGMIYCKLKSYDRANDDLTRCMNFLDVQKCATVFQLRAEAREALGRLEEARQDEEQAAQIWETAEVVHPGMEGKPKKFLV